MKQSFLKLFFLILSIILISNLSFINNIIEPSIGKSYHFQSADGAFEYVVIPSKGRDIALMERMKKEYEQQHEHSIVLYRTFQKQAYKFWCWGEYWWSPLWEYEYLEKRKFDSTY